MSRKQTSGSTFIRVAKDKSNPYVMLNKEVVANKSLSWKAKGIHSYLLSLPDDWQIYETHLEQMATDGRASLKSGLKELEDSGYLVKEIRRDSNGRFSGYEYTIYETFHRSRFSDNGFSDNGFSDNGKSATTNKELVLSNKETNSTLSSSNDRPPYKEIITYLNDCTGKCFKHSTRATQRLINARTTEGFSLDDFKRVIDIKVADWKGDPKMERFLRPNTLFSTKFEGYLNSAPSDSSIGLKVGERNEKGQVWDGESWLWT